MQIIHMLQHLSLAVSDIGHDDVKRVAKTINVKVCEAVDASVVKLYWKASAEKGIILNPIDCINNTSYTSPKPFQVDDRPGGILSWIVHNRRTLWLEDIQSVRRSGQRMTALSVRQAAPVAISPEYDDFGDGPPLQSMVSVPLFNEHGEISGIYSVELLEYGVITQDFIDILERLGRSLARLLWESEVTSQNLNNTGKAVDKFLESSADIPLSVSLGYKSCFIARQFEPDFEHVEQIVAACSRQMGIRARSYRPGTGPSVIEDIMKHIRTSHFAIVDITGANANVMAELGMMMILPCSVMLLRRKGDETPAPFNISMYPIYDYEVDSDRDELFVYVPVSKTSQPFDNVLSAFVSSLPPEAGFRSAKEWQGDE